MPHMTMTQQIISHNTITDIKTQQYTIPQNIKKECGVNTQINLAHSVRIQRLVNTPMYPTEYKLGQITSVTEYFPMFSLHYCIA